MGVSHPGTAWTVGERASLKVLENRKNLKESVKPIQICRPAGAWERKPLE